MSLLKKTGKASLVIIIFTLISKFLGFIREVLIASNFGTGYESDAYFIAFTACTVIIEVIGFSFEKTLIPIFSRIEIQKGKEAKIKFLNDILNIVILIMIVLMFFSIIFSPYIIRILARGFKGEQFNLVVKLFRIGLPMIIFIESAYILTSFLQSSGKFSVAAGASIPYNIILIIYLSFFTHEFGVVGLMIFTVIAASAKMLIQIPSTYRIGYSYKFEINIKDNNIRKTVFLIGPVIVGSAIRQINVVIDRTLASQLPEGSISALTYADRLYTLLLSVFVIAISTVIFPLLSREASKGNIDLIKKIINYGLKITIFFLVPLTIGIVILAEPIVRVIFSRGAFSSRSTTMTSIALTFYSIGLLGFGIREILINGFYSMHDNKTPMINGIVSVGINIVLNFILVKHMAHAGLALATSISGICSAVLLFISLNKKLGGIGTIQYIYYLLKCGFSASVMGIAVCIINMFLNSFYIYDSFIAQVIKFGLIVITGASIYFTICYLLKIKEVKNVIDNYFKRLFKFR